MWKLTLAQQPKPLTLFQYVTRILIIYLHITTRKYLLKAYLTDHKFDVVCLSETYLDSNTASDNVKISGYNLIRSDHPTNIKRGGVCIY